MSGYFWAVVILLISVGVFRWVRKEAVRIMDECRTDPTDSQ